MKPKNRNDLTSERLRELLSYDPETGDFRCVAKRPGLKFDRMDGRKKNQGYLLICVDRYAYSAHRLAWLYVHGKWPADQIDHINGVRDDNRIANLREATHTQNHQNRENSPKNVSGHPGVSRHKMAGKWRAQISHFGKYRHLGVFDSIEDAVEARKAAKAEYHTFQPVDRL